MHSGWEVAGHHWCKCNDYFGKYLDADFTIRQEERPIMATELVPIKNRYILFFRHVLSSMAVMAIIPILFLVGTMAWYHDHRDAQISQHNKEVAAKVAHPHPVTFPAFPHPNPDILFSMWMMVSGAALMVAFNEDSKTHWTTAQEMGVLNSKNPEMSNVTPFSLSLDQSWKIKLATLAVAPPLVALPAVNWLLNLEDKRPDLEYPFPEQAKRALSIRDEILSLDEDQRTLPEVEDALEEANKVVTAYKAIPRVIKDDAAKQLALQYLRELNQLKLAPISFMVAQKQVMAHTLEALTQDNQLALEEINRIQQKEEYDG